MADGVTAGSSGDLLSGQMTTSGDFLKCLAQRMERRSNRPAPTQPPSRRPRERFAEFDAPRHASAARAPPTLDRRPRLSRSAPPRSPQPPPTLTSSSSPPHSLTASAPRRRPSRLTRHRRDLASPADAHHATPRTDLSSDLASSPPATAPPRPHRRRPAPLTAAQRPRQRTADQGSQTAPPRP
jgi:hypothetical protein